MGLARLIVIAIAIWLAIYMLRRLFKQPSPPSSGDIAKDMVRCAQCGLHLPKAEAISDQGQYYCCQEHRQQHGRPS
jgi:uncharacterized protein